MRAIKFRLYYHKVTEDKWIIAEEFTIEELVEKKITWDKERCRLVEWTGLLDKNKKEIYEGDIVNTFDSLNVSSQNRKQHVHWNNYAAAWIPFGFHAYAVKQAYNDKKELTADCEVIGNIYEHPEKAKP